MFLLARKLSLALALAAALVTAGAARPAGALTLDGLAAGASFTTGTLTFSNFTVTVAGALTTDLSQYPVQVLGDGFRLGGPLSVLFGEGGTLMLSYDVTTSAPAGLAGASLFAAGSVVGEGARTYVGESLFGAGGTPLGSLFVFALTGASPVVFDSLGLSGPTQISVVKTVNLRSGTLAALPFVDQRFVVVPEPLSFALMATGLAGLALSGRRRA